MDLSSMDSKRYSAKDFVYMELKKLIISGELEPSQQINEKALAEQLDISRTPIREALHRIELEELIVRMPNGRIKVAPVSVEEAKEIFTVRSLLEGVVAKEAAIKITESELEELKFLTDLLMRSAEQGDNEKVIFYGDKFHHMLYDVSGNRTVVKILNNMNDHIMRYRGLGPKTSKSRSTAAAEEHLALYKIIELKDGDKAEVLMREHIQNSLEAAVQSIQRHLELVDIP
ncbi:GntR family transcriptional regulator [Planococcus glaciei]|uniref:GntR family transcriptional regulator n=1 Tax=Planococcus glaciei TaxID=459472 RepID=UPI001C72EC81|nr:GntR family transcriptional regulator [Planococcus glaciei]MBX0314647.1 GntR family transcriptional regulator [Planococcus glaciei]